MQKFDYRSPRFAVDLPVHLTLHGSTLAGRCKDISTEGMRLELLEPLPPDAFGTVSISYKDRTIELDVRVAHAQAADGGMEFVYKSDSERQAVAYLIASLTAARTPLRPVLVN